jgi:hypothetical protein
MEKINVFEAVKKWRVILESDELNIDKNHYRMFAYYVEMIDQTSHDKGLLPINIKLLSKINLNREIEFINEEISAEKKFKMEISDNSKIEDISENLFTTNNNIFRNGIPYLESYENDIVNDLINYINKIEERLYIHKLIDKMSIIRIGDKNYLQIISKIGLKIEDRRRKINKIKNSK